MNSKIFLNEYIKADIVSDILSQNISEARKKIADGNDSNDVKELLKKLLKYDEEVKKGNVEVMNKIIKGEI